MKSVNSVQPRQPVNCDVRWNVPSTHLNLEGTSSPESSQNHPREPSSQLYFIDQFHEPDTPSPLQAVIVSTRQTRYAISSGISLASQSRAALHIHLMLNKHMIWYVIKRVYQAINSSKSSSSVIHHTVQIRSTLIAAAASKQTCTRHHYQLVTAIVSVGRGEHEESL